MSKTPENCEQTRDVDINQSPDKKSTTVSVERQIEVAKKYGITDEQIAKMLDENASDEEKHMVFVNITRILANAILHTLVDPEDVEDVSAIVGPRWGVSKEKYLPFFSKKHGL
jgi:ribosomal 50S subunit-recycling heat shock protein